MHNDACDDWDSHRSNISEAAIPAPFYILIAIDGEGAGRSLAPPPRCVKGRLGAAVAPGVKGQVGENCWRGSTAAWFTKEEVKA
jgi:hypothetical protein